ncbi:MAG: 2-phospho-L-lactate guanylyltransferase [Pseudomonadota bacterium]
MSRNTLLVIPMKDPLRSKTRLGGAICQAERARLARQLFRRTLALVLGLREDRPRFDVAVVTGAAEIAEHARRTGAKVIAEPEGPTGLNRALAHAAETACAQGYRRLAVLPADLAAPDPADVARLMALDLGPRGLALCASRDFGTNALLAAPPDVVPFAYGPRSFHAHRARAEAAGLTPITVVLESLRWDIDGAEDLAELLAQERGA